jgi:alkylhydroperoxidase family enzyme
LDARLRELVILQIGYCSGSDYEFSHHIEIGHDFGVSDEDIHALMAETRGEDSNLGKLDRLAITAAREMVKQGAIQENTLASLTTLLSNQEVIELVMIASFYVGVVHLLASLNIDVETDYLPYLAQFPFAGS